jgi:ubiquinone/menaquinone biosynthesis C-methylase UbiE
MLSNEDKSGATFSGSPWNTGSVEHFDAISAHYANAYSLNNAPASYFFKRRQAIVLSLLQQKNGGVLLDAGCGPGVYSEHCSRRGFHYYGLDASPAMISEAVRQYGKLENARFHVGRIESLPYPGKSYDVLLCLGGLEYLERAHVPIALAEFQRVLKPGGVLIISVLNRSSFYWLWADWFYPTLRFCYRNAKALVKGSKWFKFDAHHDEGLPTRKYRTAAMEKLLRALDFNSIEHTYFAVGIVPQPFDTWLPYRVTHVLRHLEPLVNVRGFSWLARGYIITASRNDLQAK